MHVQPVCLRALGRWGRRRKNVVSRRLHFSLLFWLAARSVGRAHPYSSVINRKLPYLVISRIRRCFLCVTQLIRHQDVAGSLSFHMGEIYHLHRLQNEFWRNIIISARRPSGSHSHVNCPAGGSSIVKFSEHIDLHCLITELKYFLTQSQFVTTSIMMG